MSFLNKVKQWLGIGGVKVQLQVPSAISRKAASFQCKVSVTSKSDQVVKEMKLVLEEEWTTGRGEEKTRKVFELGTAKVPGFEIKAGESKMLDVELPFQLIKSNNDELKEKGGALGTLGKMGAFATAEKSDYFVKLDADVQGTVVGPNDRKSIYLSE